MSKRRLPVLFVLIALLAGAIAPPASIAQVNCSPLSAQATPDASAPVATPSAPVTIPPVEVPEDATTIRMGYIPVSIFAPVFVAYEKGYFAQQGLDVQLETLPGGSDMVLLAATGELDLGIGGIGPAYWNAASQDLGIKVIAPGHQEGSPVASPLMISKKACESGTIKSVADLKGKKVAVNAPGATEYWLDTALRTGGLTIADVDLQYMPFPDAVLALDSGALDASIIGEPLATKAEQDGLAVRLLADFPVQGIQPTMIFGNEQWMADNADATTKFVAAYLQAARDLTENFNDPLNLAIIEKYTQVPAALIAGSVKPVYAVDGTIDLNSMSTLQTFFRDRGLLDYDTDLDPATLVDTTYVDGALQLIGQP